MKSFVLIVTQNEHMEDNRGEVLLECTVASKTTNLAGSNPVTLAKIIKIRRKARFDSEGSCQDCVLDGSPRFVDKNRLV